MAAEKREKAPDLAVLVGVGKPKPNPKSKGPMGDMGPMMDLGDEDDMGPSSEFESAALEAFPDMTPKQVSALYRAVKAARE